MLRRIPLTINTIKYLKPSQLFYQGLHRIMPQGSFLEYINEDVSCIDFDLWINELDGNESYIDRFYPDDLVAGSIHILNEERFFDRWSFEEASPLWNFNVQYLEYLVSLVGKAKATNDYKYIDRMNAILDEWMMKGCKEPDATHPYTISLRITNLFIIYRYIKNKDKLIPYIYAQYRYLLNHQEKHLLGNHYLENLKTILICSIAFGDSSTYEKYSKKFLKEVRRQILSDGFHFELSPMYHRIILENLIRVGYAMQQINAMEYKDVIAYVHKMTDAMDTIERGTSRIPLFNDSGEGVSKSKEALTKSVERLFGIHSNDKVLLHDSGYYKVYDSKITLIIDGGYLGPSYIPGHGHCDCLSFELFYNNQPVFVNAGTYQYQGEYRKYFRSTEAHNTIVINNHEQSELWREHRAARRLRRVKCNSDEERFEGTYINYAGEKHNRSIKLINESLKVLDKTSGKGVVKSFLHLAPGLHYENGKIKVENLSLSISISPLNAHVTVINTPYSDTLGVLSEIETLVFIWNNDTIEHGYIINFKGEKE